MNNARYLLDFRVMPELLERIGDDYIRRCRELKEDFVCLIFNQFLEKLSGGQAAVCPTDQFRVSEHVLNDRMNLLYIELPAADEAPVFCTAYAIAFSDTPDGIRDVRYYTVERSILGTGCIGSMSADSHLNFGKAYPTVQENVQAIRSLVCRV